MAEYDKHIPVYLIDLEPIEFRGEINVDDTETDYNNGRYHFSNTYSINGNGYSEDDGEYKYYADYSLGRKFKYFSGVLHGIRNSAGPGAKKCLRIYGDGVLLKEFNVKEWYDPYEFCIDVTGVNILRIEYVDGGAINYLATICDGKFSRE